VEVWLQVARAIDRFVGDEQEFRAWIFSIARNKVIDQVRRDARRPTRLFVGTGEINGNGHDTRDVAEDYEDDQATRQAFALVRGLPPTQAEVILLRVIAGLDPAHVARLLGKTPGAVRVLSLRGLRRLAGILPAQSDNGRREPISGDPRLLVDTARAKPYASSHPKGGPHRIPRPSVRGVSCPDGCSSVNPVDHSEPWS
jgi:RNA polymerase sigma-70 factor (ECF subfamily)